MSNVKISELPAATSAGTGDEIPANQSGTTRKLTQAQIVADRLPLTGGTMTGNLTVPSINNGPLAGFRNAIINGGMEIAQRGTSGTSGYLIDRWTTNNTSAQSQSSDAPAEFLNSLEFTSNTATFPYFEQNIERANLYHLAGQTCTLSFWAKSVSGSSSLFFEIYRADANDNFGTVTLETAATLATSPSTSWVKYTATFTLSSSATTGIRIRIVRNDDSAASTRVTGVQLEAGPVATPFERRPIGTELALCQRYYFGTGAQFNSAHYAAGGGVAGYHWYSLPVAMRIAPTVTASWASLVNATAGTFRMADIKTVETSIISSMIGGFGGVVTYSAFSAEF
jgi:hypothetical protein